MKAKIDWKSKLQEYLPFICLILFIVIFQIGTDGRLLQLKSLKSMVNEVFTLMLGTSGMAFLLSQGCLDFSIAANVAFSCTIGAIAANINPLLALPAALLSGLLIGFLNGVLHGVLKVQSFIATLAMSFVLKGVTTLILGSGSMSVPYKMLNWNSVELRLVVILLVAVVGYIVFEKTRIGKEGKVVGANPEFATQSGISVVKVKIRGFMIMGGICGIVAFFALIRSATASVSSGAGFEVNSLNAMLLGGMAISGGTNSRFRSAIVGTLVMAVLLTGMNMMHIHARTQQIIEGLVFLVAVSMTFDRKNTQVVK